MKKEEVRYMAQIMEIFRYLQQHFNHKFCTLRLSPSQRHPQYNTSSRRKLTDWKEYSDKSWDKEEDAKA